MVDNDKHLALQIKSNQIETITAQTKYARN